MENPLTEAEAMSNEELLESIKILLGREHETVAAFVARLAVIDERRLWEATHSSLYAYLTKGLAMSEDAAMCRITTARTALKFPLALQLIRCGQLHMTSLMRLAPHLTLDNQERLLLQASGKSIHDVAKIVAEVNPRPDIADHIQHSPRQAIESAQGTQLAQSPQSPPPLPSPAGLPISPGRLPAPGRQKITPLAPDRIYFSFTGSEALLAKIKRARTLLWHKFPKGMLENVIDAALEDLLDKRDPERKALRLLKRASTKQKPASDGRRIPQWVKHEVWKRDNGKCVHEAPDGSKCGEEGGLEYDHVIPFARGGRSDEPGNVRLLCRTHNQANARKDFGEAAARHIRH